MKNRIALSFLGRLVAAVVLVAGVPSLAAAQQDGKLDAVLRDRSTRLAGWSRVIVEFTGEPDGRVFGRGTTGRRVGQQMQAGEVENTRSEEHTSELQSQSNLVCRLLLEKKKK